MAKLILTSFTNPAREYSLDLPDVSIGRRPDNYIAIRDPAISGRHARIICILGDYFLEDLGSTNGTHINSRPIKKHALEDGDVIRIGECQLRFVTNAVSEQTATLCGGNISALKSGTPKPANKPTASLKMINGSTPGATITITKSLTTLGKPGQAVAAITRRANGEFYIIDVESTHKQQSLINGKPLSSESMALNDHDVIEVAGTCMKFYLDAVPTQAAEDGIAIKEVKI